MSMMRGVGPCFAAATLAAALSLAISSDGSSIYGLTSILAGAFWPVVGMGAALDLGSFPPSRISGQRYGALPSCLAFPTFVGAVQPRTTR